MAGENWLTGWGYRKSHVINAQTGAGTLYQTLIKVYYGSGTDGTEVINGITAGKVYCDSKCKTDFGDVRFTDDDGSTELDYWFENELTAVDDGFGIFWVEVADSLESDPATIYIYYGKADATTTSNGANTFPFFDDFINASIDTNIWTVNLGSPSVANSVITLPANANCRIDSKTYQGSSPTRLYFKWRRDLDSLATTSDLGEIGFGRRSTQVDADFVILRNWVTATLRNYQLGSKKAGSESLVTVNPASGFASWVKDFLLWESTSTELISTYGNPKVTNTDYIPVVSINVKLTLFDLTTGNALYLDWILATKYTSPEPTHGAWGNEEEPPPITKPSSGNIVTMMRAMGLI